ncbi:MAG: hypothetical protein IGNPGNKH_00247 [Sodalis sp. Ffu]|nr:MAG: hypothetical protein IGNPGNKH_00247 [Sodalis sp. Ffu]
MAIIIRHYSIYNNLFFFFLWKIYTEIMRPLANDNHDIDNFDLRYWAVGAYIRHCCFFAGSSDANA